MLTGVILFTVACTVPDIHVVPTDKSGAENAGDGDDGRAGEGSAGDGGQGEAGSAASAADGGKGGEREAGGGGRAGVAGGRSKGGEGGRAGSGGAAGTSGSGAGAGAAAPNETAGADAGASGAGAGGTTAGSGESSAGRGGNAGGGVAGAGGASGGGSGSNPACAVWKPATSGDAGPPANAFAAGSERHSGEDHTQYICRVRPPNNNNAYAIGKVIFGYQCYVTYLVNGTPVFYVTMRDQAIDVFTPGAGCTLGWADATDQTRPSNAFDLGSGGVAAFACHGFYSGPDTMGIQLGSVLQKDGAAHCFFESFDAIHEPQTPAAYQVLVLQ